MAESPTFRIQTLFYWCNDVASVRHFYSELIGLEETYFKDDVEAGWLNYHVGSVDVVFMRSSEACPVQTAWAKQPGYLGGIVETHSFIIAVAAAKFPIVVERLQEAGVPTFEAEPTNGQFFVQDPMGMTVELFVG